VVFFTSCYIKAVISQLSPLLSAIPGKQHPEIFRRLPGRYSVRNFQKRAAFGISPELPRRNGGAAIGENRIFIAKLETTWRTIV
jgi:hypothetical protein